MIESCKLEHMYALRVAREELMCIDTLEARGRSGRIKEALFLQGFPHVVRFMTTRRVVFVLRHIQNFCWTVERMMRRLWPLVSPVPVFVCAPKIEDAAETGGRVRPSIWIDMSHTYRDGFAAGISRVTLNLQGAAAKTGLALPVLIDDGEVYEFLGPQKKGERLEFTSMVTFVLADCFWCDMAATRRACGTARAAGALIVVCIHDVIPFYYPSFSGAAFVRSFVAAVEEVLATCDACIAVSHYSAMKVKAFTESRNLRLGRALPVTHFHLGADALCEVDPEKAKPNVRAIFNRKNVFLSVGTLEPRKGYAVTLDAFDVLWDAGLDTTFVIIGKSGWLSAALEWRILEHPLLGVRLFWFDDGSDADLAFSYRHAHALVQASVTEGFGLPLVEAGRLGTPVIATDNAVFREIAGQAITYFRGCDVDHLVQKLKAAIEEPPFHEPIPTLSWTESLTQMVDRVSSLRVTVLAS